MTGFVWLTSYPKSGNTWLRLLIANLDADGGTPADINALSRPRGIASSREWIEEATLIDSGPLTDDEADRLRPVVYRAWAAELARDCAATGRSGGGLTRFVKCHDAYTRLDDGQPLLGGSEAARGAIAIVRDPRDIAPSLADHRGCSIDEAIDFMADPQAAQARSSLRHNRQLRQRLLDWTGHVASWLDQSDIPVHLVAYESLHADPAAALAGAMSFARRPVTEAQVARSVRFSAFEALRDQEESRGFSEARPGRRFFRRGEVGGWRTVLSARQIARIEAAHGTMMARLGYAMAG